MPQDPPRRTFIGVAGSATLVLFSGCLNTEGTGDSMNSTVTGENSVTLTEKSTGTATKSEVQSRTEVPPPETTSTENCEYQLYVVEAGNLKNQTERTIEYEDLPEQRKSEFREALENGGSVEIGDEVPSPWNDAVLLIYSDEEYYVDAAIC